MGFERASARWTCAFSNDLDPVKRRIYARHFSEAVESIDASDVHKLSGLAVPDVDVATASFPCTDLSLAGGRRGIRSGESSAFWGFQRVIDEMGARRPAAILLENVVGLLSSNYGADFRDLLRAMNHLGYAADPIVIDARWFVPQSRPRLFVVCLHREKAAVPDHRAANVSRLRPEKLVDFTRRHADLVWAFADLPDPPAQTSRRIADIVKDPPISSEEWWSEERVAYLYDQMFPRHQLWIDGHRELKAFHYATAFRRVRPQGDGTKRSMAELRTDGIAGCLRTPKGGSGRQILVRTGKGRLDVRLLSGAECASLMGADGYKLDCTLNQALFGFGDAVCVDAVAWIAKHCIEPALR